MPRPGAESRDRGLATRPAPGAWARACVLALLGVLAALVPLAHASPPDPLWIPGIYDAADFDEVVVAVLTAVARAADTRSVSFAPPARAGATVVPAEVRLAPGASLPALPVRAPPVPALPAAA